MTLTDKPARGLVAVARLAGVSVATVSNVINRPQIVAEATRERVQTAMQQLDFIPNRAAADLRKGANRLLGLVIPDITNPFYSAITSAIADETERNRYSLALGVCHDDPETERRHFEMLAQQRASGVIVIPLTADSSRLARLRKAGSRLILVDRLQDTTEGCSVAIDDVYGGKLAVRHLLLSNPTQDVVIVNGPLSIPQCQHRRQGARAALAEAQRDPHKLREIEVEAMTIDAGREAGRRIAASHLPRSVFCANDQLAAGVIRGLADYDVLTPRDAAVVGYGDLSLALEIVPTLTTVRQPKQEMGQTAVKLMLAELREGTAHQHTATMLPPELVIRDSTPAPPA